MPSQKQLDNERLLYRIREVLHEHSRRTLGAGRLHEDPAEEGESASLNRVAPLMAANDLKAGRAQKGGKRSQRERDLTTLEPETK